MQIHQLPSIKKRVQRIGRSGKRGSYSGRGVKGQKSRSGRRLRPAERDVILRIPKRRGFANHPSTEKPFAVNVGELADALKSFVEGKKVLALTTELLKTAGILKKSFRGTVKILAEGEITFPVAVNGFKVSEGARKKIQKVGGTVN